MKALLYLKKRSFINWIKKAVRTPKAYFLFVLILFYCGMMGSYFTGIAGEIGGIGVNNFVAIITILLFLTTSTSVIAYVKRRGIVFKKADINLSFASPLSPKLNLLFAKGTSFLLSIAIGFAFGAFGLFGFHTEVLPTILFTLFFIVIQTVFEGSLIIILYGSEVLSKKVMTIINALMYLVILGFAAGCLAFMLIKGFSFATLSELLISPIILGVPVIGWCAAVANLLFFGPSLYSVIFSLCYLVCFIVVFLVAKKMKCTGGYYEDALKFADDYEEARTRGKRGEVARIGKKRKYKKAQIEYKGTYAKAIFYRHILEYKKNRFFIFGGRTILIVILSIAVAVIFSFTEVRQEIGVYAIFAIPAIMFYIDLVFSGYITKWGKEMTYATLFLIPDTPFKKLWYATLTEHIRALVDALILTLPAAIVLGISIPNMILTILACVLIQANKLYIRVFVHGIFRDSIGLLGKQMFQLLFYGIIVSIAVVPTIFLTIGLGMSVGFFAFCGIMVCITLLCMFLAAEFFGKMEAIGE